MIFDCCINISYMGWHCLFLILGIEVGLKKEYGLFREEV
jgi:hypothetical protein